MVEDLIPNSSKKMQDKLSLWNESRAIIGSILLITILVACQPAQLVEDAPTPIPTLIPATMPPSGIEPTSSALLIESYPAGLPSANNGNALYDDLCADCHGLDGKAIAPEYPNLAGQYPSYMEKALRDYRDGRRTNAIMAPMVAGLSDQDIADLAAWYGKQEGLEDISIK